MCFEELKLILDAREFKKSDVYPFLIISEKMVSVSYADYCILFYSYQKGIGAVLKPF